jgi:hypothetical protein
MQGPLFDAVPDDGAGGGGGKPAAFDHAAFRAQILGDVTKLVTGLGASLKADFAKFAPAEAVAEPEPVAVTDPAAGVVKPPTVDPNLAAEIRALQRTNKELADKFAASQTQSAAKEAAANKKELDAMVRTELTKFKFADEAAAQDAFDIFGSKVKRTDDGEFVGPDGTSIKLYLEEAMRTKPYLLAIKDTGGAGSRTGGRAPGAKRIDLDAVKPGMSAEDLAATRAEIMALMPR